jgi:hypothetical protein
MGIVPIMGIAVTAETEAQTQGAGTTISGGVDMPQKDELERDINEEDIRILADIIISEKAEELTCRAQKVKKLGAAFRKYQGKTRGKVEQELGSKSDIEWFNSKPFKKASNEILMIARKFNVEKSKEPEERKGD